MRFIKLLSTLGLVIFVASCNTKEESEIMGQKIVDRITIINTFKGIMNNSADNNLFIVFIR